MRALFAKSTPSAKEVVGEVFSEADVEHAWQILKPLGFDLARGKHARRASILAAASHGDLDRLKSLVECAAESESFPYDDYYYWLHTEDRYRSQAYLPSTFAEFVAAVSHDAIGRGLFHTTSLNSLLIRKPDAPFEESVVATPAVDGGIKVVMWEASDDSLYAETGLK